MPDYLAIDWEQNQIVGLEAQVSSGRIRLRTGLHLTVPDGLDSGESAQALGRWLREELDKRRVATRAVLVSIPREDAVVRRLELPNAPDDELPDLVRMQAATKSATPLDQLMLDYVPLPVEPGAVGREVLMVTITRPLGDRIAAALSAADLELRSIGLSSIGTAELVVRAERQRSDDAQGTSLIVGRQGHRLEIAIVRGGRLTFSHAAQLRVEGEERANRLVLTEIQRSIVAQQSTSGTGQIDRIWVMGTDDETRGLLPLLAERFSSPVTALDPLQDAVGGGELSEVPESHVALAGPVGMLLASTGAQVEAIDFANPRRRVVKPDRRRFKMAVAAAGGVVALGTAYGLLQLRLSRLDEAITTTKQEIRTLDETLKKGAPTIAAYQAINGWELTQSNWLQRVQELNELLPGTDRMYLTDLTVAPSGVADTATVKGTGYAKDRADVEELERRLRGAGYTVMPQKSAERRGGDYPLPFTLDLVLDLTPEPEPAATAVAEARP